MPGGGFHSPYPPEFRAEAVRLVGEGGRTISEVAKGLGVTTESVRLWVKQSDLNAGRRSDGLTSDEREELRQLRRENQRLRQEKEILKRAAAFFAAETNPIR
jgi:transposase